MARHPWVEKADSGVRFGVQIGAMGQRTSQTEVVLHDDAMRVLVESGKLVDRLGYDGLFLHDHPSFSPDPWTGLAALAVATENVTLGSVVFCVPYRHPTHLARLTTDVDHLSNGRLMLGIGIGWAVAEFHNLGFTYDSITARQEQLVEAVEVLRGSLTGESFSYSGKHYTVEDSRIMPRPVQRPLPPLMIAGGGAKVTLRQVAQYGDACNFGDLSESQDPFKRNPRLGVELITERLNVLRRHCETVGRPYDEILRTHFVWWLMVAPTEAEVRAKFRHYFGDDPSPQSRGAVVGTPEQVAEYFQARADAGMQYLVFQALDGADHETLQLTATEVMPQIH